MIPKVIHYCWFGGSPLPEDVKGYIQSWRKYCPDYEIKEWNETSFDVSANMYCREAYEAKKWAFVSDYARMKILYDEGGIYLDSDVEVCRSLDSFLKYNAFSGFESDDRIQTGTFGACQGAGWIERILKYYDNRHFKLADGTLDMTTNVVLITRITAEEFGVQLDNTYQVFGDNYALFPFDYLCAKNLETGKINRTEHTYTIHHFSGSWLDSGAKFRRLLKKPIVGLLGEYYGEKFIKSVKSVLK